MLNDPRCDFASGVRLLATMTASLNPRSSSTAGLSRRHESHESHEMLDRKDIVFFVSFVTS
jgi:hypothetical protein